MKIGTDIPCFTKTNGLALYEKCAFGTPTRADTSRPGLMPFSGQVQVIARIS